VVADYLEKSGLQKELDKIGFNLVGFGCTSCIGNSGPLAEEISESISKNDVVAAAVLSGNRNFEGRVNADVRANYLASPPLVVAYALAGNMNVDVARTPIGTDTKGKKVYLRDIWPTSREIANVIRKTVNKNVFARKYADVFKGEANWRKISVKGGLTYDWDDRSTYVQNPPYFEGMEKKQHPIDDIVDAHERIWDMLENYKEVVDSLAETNESVISHRVNDILRVLTSISVIVLPLTLIASIWGMNSGVPGEQDLTAFWIIVGVMAGLLVGMVAYFRRRGWL